MHFAGTTRPTPNNNYGDNLQFQQILFDSAAGSFTLNGGGIMLNNNNNGVARIENNSSALQTINFNSSGNSVLMESDVELDPTLGDLTINGAVKADNHGGVINVYGNTSHTLTFNGAIGQNSVAGSLVVQGSSNVIFNAANTYTGSTSINAGSIRVNVAPSNAAGTYFVGNGGTTETAASLFLGATGGGMSFANVVSAYQGSPGNRVIGGLNTSGTNTFTGDVNLNDNNVTLVATSGGTVAFNTVASYFRTVAINGGAYTGTVQFGGTVDNTVLSVTVNSGTLLLSKTSTSTKHAIGGTLTIDNGGTAVLSGTGGDQIPNSAAVTLAGGTLARAATVVNEGTGISRMGTVATTGTNSVGIGALTLSANSTIDFGTGTMGTLTFASFAANGFTLNILNDDAGPTTATTPVTDGAYDRLIFDQDESLALGQFSFNGVGAQEISLGGGYFEIVPVPEPSTVFAGMLAMAVLAWSQRQRLAGHYRRFAPGRKAV